jgi:hypothetical protein
MSKLKDFIKFANKNYGRAQFATIYLEEIHATDGWSLINHKWSFKQHEKIDDRKAAAHDLEQEMMQIYETLTDFSNEVSSPPVVLVDGMENMADYCFGALPERLAILHKSKLVFLGGPGPKDYSIEECEKSLERLLQPQP